ncbi:hypothetical protein PIB30_077878 [Stylosanthes scabra]|uniref:Uncharacterized protein n=1 Tax=Stylosanthes scabra TaxID=79078 RepID=A0ABU6XR64_9FABA|nr:hypothetical protein [Stylosanthes scabra]
MPQTGQSARALALVRHRPTTILPAVLPEVRPWVMGLLQADRRATEHQMMIWVTFRVVLLPPVSFYVSVVVLVALVPRVCVIMTYRKSGCYTMLKFFSIFSLSWVFSWEYQYGKSELDHPKELPTLQRHAYVKWWSQFDSSMAYPEKVREWFKNNPRSLKISDPETTSFLNQKAQIQAALAGSQSKKSIKGKLKRILHLLQEDEELSPNEESDQEDNPNEDDCFGINLDDD